MRRNRQKNKVTDIYFIINKNLETNWLTSFLSGLLFFINLIVGISHGFGFIHGFITLFLGLILLQSIQGILGLRKLRKKLLINPQSVNIHDINSAPNIKTTFWFS